MLLLLGREQTVRCRKSRGRAGGSAVQMKGERGLACEPGIGIEEGPVLKSEQMGHEEESGHKDDF